MSLRFKDVPKKSIGIKCDNNNNMRSSKHLHDNVSANVNLLQVSVSADTSEF